MLIRKGTKDDVSAILDIYDSILDLEEKGLTTIGWIRGVYPNEVSLADCLRADELYVLEDEGKVLGASRINKVQMDAYALAKWQYHDIDPEKVLVIHTLVIDPKTARTGYGKAFIAFYENLAKEIHCPYLRLDTNERNQRARSFYKSLGYWEVGVVPCNFNGIEGIGLVCLEKYLGE